MKNWRFCFGVFFCAAVDHLLDLTGWSWHVDVLVAVVLFFVVEYFVHKIAVS